jgi:hypothetical protein
VVVAVAGGALVAAEVVAGGFEPLPEPVGFPVLAGGPDLVGAAVDVAGVADGLPPIGSPDGTIAGDTVGPVSVAFGPGFRTSPEVTALVAPEALIPVAGGAPNFQAAMPPARMLSTAPTT